jgi:hypothetical protein
MRSLVHLGAVIAFAVFVREGLLAEVKVWEADLAFTRDGMEPIVNAARTQYLLGTIYQTCGKPEQAKAGFNVLQLPLGPIKCCGHGKRPRNCRALMSSNGAGD